MASGRAGVGAAREKLRVRAPYRAGLSQADAPQHTIYPYVLTGYRSGGTYARCLRSLFEAHSETGNAWSMLLCSGASLALLRRAQGLYPAECLTPLYAVTGSVLTHMPFSVGFHLFRPINVMVAQRWRQLDQAFIFLVSIPLAFGLAYNVLPGWGTALVTGATSAVAALGVRLILSLQPGVARDRALVTRSFAHIVLCYWAPMLLQATADVYHTGRLTANAGYAAGVLASLLTAAVFFVNGLPERAFPRTFDVVGFSHQIMHLMATVAHLLEFSFVEANLPCRLA